MGGTVNRVIAGSPADNAGLMAGDELLLIDGYPVQDVIDVRFHGDDPDPVVTVRRAGRDRDVVVRKHEGEDLGLEFADGLFDGIISCCNRCVFCFIDQLPQGLRRSLYVKDDDFRLSFLHGAYVTLTNLHADEEQRIIDQALSPLYVSVHAVTGEVRRELLGSKRADRTLKAMARLASRGITFHCQIVVCPGINDGEELVRTLDYLLGLGQAVRSVAVVPVGLTCHRQGAVQLRGCSAKDARAIIDCVQEFRRRWQEKTGRNRGVVQAADELYLAADKPIPAASEYGGFLQLDNGVGLVRLFLDEVAGQAVPMQARPMVMVTGELFAPLLRNMVQGSNVEVVAVRNSLLGSEVTVAGLLSGQDVIKALTAARVEPDTIVVVPDCVIRSEDRSDPARGLLLDGYTMDQIGAETGADIRVVAASGSGFLTAVRGDEDE